MLCERSECMCEKCISRLAVTSARHTNRQVSHMAADECARTHKGVAGHDDYSDCLLPIIRFPQKTDRCVDLALISCEIVTIRLARDMSTLLALRFLRNFCQNKMMACLIKFVVCRVCVYKGCVIVVVSNTASKTDSTEMNYSCCSGNLCLLILGMMGVLQQ